MMHWPPCCRVAPWQHQIIGTNTILGQLSGFLLMDDVGFGKSKQTIDAICHEVTEGRITRLVVVTPGFARSVWASPDPLLGEFAKHAWEGIVYRISEYSAKHDKLPKNDGHRHLDVVVTNYEFIRRVEDIINPKTGRPRREKAWPRLAPLIEWAKNGKTWLVLDESWSIENPQADQSKACWKLRQACVRPTLLNGTPGTPDKLFTQFQIISPKILECKNFFQFRGRYCKMGGWGNKKIVEYKNMEEFERRTKAYGLRRDTGLDIPPVLPPITIEAQLSEKEWAIYKSMRDDFLAWLDGTDSVTVARQAGTRTLRLAQILAGFVGGVEEADLDDDESPLLAPVKAAARASDVREIGRSKLDAILEYCAALDLNRIIVWSRFRPEMGRMAEALKRFGRPVYLLQGNQKADERNAAKRAFAPGTADAPDGAFLVGHPKAGGAGLNFAAASIAIYATNPWSLKDRKQSEGRINRPGQTRPVRFVDVVAVGPSGQKTLDHGILRALRAQEDVANWTADIWRRVLSEE